MIEANLIVSPNQNWTNCVETSLNNLKFALKRNKDCTKVLSDFEQLKQEYIEYYLHLHLKKRLNATENKKRIEILQSNEYQALNILGSKIELLPGNVFKDWQENVK